MWGTWNLDPALLVLLGLTAWAYLRGLRVLWPGGRARRGVGPWRASAFLGGLVALFVALVSPLDHAAGQTLSAHMGQHLVLILVAAPLLVLGRPGLVVLSSWPPAARRVVHRVAHRGGVRAAGALLTTPVVAWFGHVLAVWAWHLPGAYQAALASQPLHTVEHGTFLATACLFWWVALEPGSHRRLARGGDVLYLLTAWVQSGALGALLTFAASPVYAAYAGIPGVDPLRDQQLAGLIMWVPAGAVYLGSACMLFVSWLRGLEESQRRAEAGTEARGVVRA